MRNCGLQSLLKMWKGLKPASRCPIVLRADYG